MGDRFPRYFNPRDPSYYKKIKSLRRGRDTLAEMTYNDWSRATHEPLVITIGITRQDTPDALLATLTANTHQMRYQRH